MTAFQIHARPRRRGAQAKKCEAPGCLRSASHDGVFLGAYHTWLCLRHAKEWADAWYAASHGWPDEIAGESPQ